MNYIHFALSLAVSFLIAFPSSAANPTTADLTLQSQQRLNGMRDALGLDENHSFQMQNLTQDTRGRRMSGSVSSTTAFASGAVK